VFPIPLLVCKTYSLQSPRLPLSTPGLPPTYTLAVWTDQHHGLLCAHPKLAMASCQVVPAYASQSGRAVPCHAAAQCGVPGHPPPAARWPQFHTAPSKRVPDWPDLGAATISAFTGHMHDQAAGIPTGARQPHCSCGGPGPRILEESCRQAYSWCPPVAGNLASKCRAVATCCHTDHVKMCWPQGTHGGLCCRWVLCCRCEHACFHAHAETSQGTHTVRGQIHRVQNHLECPGTCAVSATRPSHCAAAAHPHCHRMPCMGMLRYVPGTAVLKYPAWCSGLLVSPPPPPSPVPPLPHTQKFLWPWQSQPEVRCCKHHLACADIDTKASPRLIRDISCNNNTQRATRNCLSLTARLQHTLPVQLLGLCWLAECPKHQCHCHNEAQQG
jgi:hypothetical protein